MHLLLHNTYFVNKTNYRTLAMQAHVLTRTRYFYSLNACAIASRSSPPSHVCIYNGQQSSALICVQLIQTHSDGVQPASEHIG
jgi:hypothetical protein